LDKFQGQRSCRDKQRNLTQAQAGNAARAGQEQEKEAGGPQDARGDPDGEVAPAGVHEAQELDQEKDRKSVV